MSGTGAEISKQNPNIIKVSPMKQQNTDVGPHLRLY